MRIEITVAFVDEMEVAVFSRIDSPSILGGPDRDEKGQYPRVRLVRRALRGEPLRAVELAALKQSLSLEESSAEREANYDAAKAAGNDDLASAFHTWLPAISEAWALVCQAESVALGGAG